MEYIVMTIEQAKKMAKKDATVLVAVTDLENPSFDVPFEKRKFRDCKEMIEAAQTIMSSCDDFMKSLELFTELQDPLDIRPKGKQGTILFKK